MLATYRLADVRRHFTYESWANQRMQAAIARLVEEPAAVQAATDAKRIWDHLIQAKRVWLSRLEAPTPGRSTRESPAAPSDPRPATPGVDGSEQHHHRDDAAGDEDDDARWRRFLATLSDHELARVVTFHNLRGEPQADALGDILTHVLMHSAYHRGQLALLLRQSGHQPPSTDFILFARSELSPPGDSRKLAASSSTVRPATA